MEPPQSIKTVTKSADPAAKTTEIQSITRHGTPINESPTKETSRHDSVIEDDTVTPTAAKAADAQTAPTGKPLNLGNSILKTPSVAASSNSSPTPSLQSSPELGASILKTPSATASSRHSDSLFPKAAGGVWLSKRDGKLWPVILCDEITAPKDFMKTRRDPSHLPAILLGKRI